MQTYLKERIGDPELFTGRREDLDFFLNWVDCVRRTQKKSAAILARRKTGKTALMQRLFNIVFHENDRVIPFYYEIKEGDEWVLNFAVEFFMTFVQQYIAYKTRNPKYLTIFNPEFGELKRIAKKEGLDYLVEFIRSVEYCNEREDVSMAWKLACEAPMRIADSREERIVQMIDEFQFINSEFYWDKEKTQLASTLCGRYLGIAESKTAPLLISGSWVGWLMSDLMRLLPGRFKFRFLRDMTDDEIVEMVFKHAAFHRLDISEEIAFGIVRMAEGNPFYVDAILDSNCPDKDLATLEGLARIYEFETLSYEGDIKTTWMEYVQSAFKRLNGTDERKSIKSIVLHLCKNRDRDLTRKEIMNDLNLDMSETELENKLKALVLADIIEQGASDFEYRGVRDNVFDKVFRGVYQKEIQEFKPDEILNEYKDLLEQSKQEYRVLQGKYNYQKGYFAEYVILNQLERNVKRRNDFFKSITHNLPEDFEFVEYDRVWSYQTARGHSTAIQLDIFAWAKDDGYSVLGEVKNRTLDKFSKAEADALVEKAASVKEIEGLEKTVFFVFSRNGLTREAIEYCDQAGIAYSDDERWLD
ncbi:MAG: hypothetical protein GY866_13820 [Proteobacteria bacterium]|nr:hypothetical protein [Pseudomonadota bacterium]